MKMSNPNIWLPACTCKHMYIHPCEFVDTYYIHMQERGGERENILWSHARGIFFPLRPERAGTTQERMLTK